MLDQPIGIHRHRRTGNRLLLGEMGALATLVLGLQVVTASDEGMAYSAGAQRLMWTPLALAALWWTVASLRQGVWSEDVVASLRETVAG